jgi:CRP-like cAMP-binding protein
MQMDFNMVRSAIKENSIFRGLNQEQLGILLMKAKSIEVPSEEQPYTKGDESDGTFVLIVSGKVNAIAENGQIMQEFGAGEVLGEVGVISPQKKRTVTVRTAQPTVALEWRFQDIEKDVPELVKRLKELAWKRIASWNE